jgi:hypothetical protein
MPAGDPNAYMTFSICTRVEGAEGTNFGLGVATDAPAGLGLAARPSRATPSTATAARTASVRAATATTAAGTACETGHPGRAEQLHRRPPVDDGPAQFLVGEITSFVSLSHGR